MSNESSTIDMGTVSTTHVHSPNRNHKDTIFRDLFGTEENKLNTLSLYNALSGKDYDDPGLLELTTLDNVIYMSVKNDTNAMIDGWRSALAKAKAR